MTSKTTLDVILDRNKKFIHQFDNYKHIDVNKITFNNKPIKDFLEKKYKWNQQDIANAYKKIDIFFNEYKIQNKIYPFIYRNIEDKNKIKKLFDWLFLDLDNRWNTEFNIYKFRRFNNLIRFINLEKISKLKTKWSIASEYTWIKELNKGSVLQDMFILYKNFNKDWTEKRALEDTYTYIRTQLKRWSVLNPYLISILLNKYKWNNLLSLVHSWQSYQLWFYASEYKKYYCNDLNSLNDNIKLLDNLIQEDYSDRKKWKDVIETNFNFAKRNIYNFYKDKNIDTVIVCPPYYDIEEYDNSSGEQSWYKDYEWFLKDLFKMIDNGIKITKKYFILIIANSKKYKLLDESLKYLENNYINNKKGKILDFIQINKKSNINMSNYLNQKIENGEFAIVFMKD